ncbi:MAG: energy-coupling factor transporter transmembrane component T [Anaerolineae bacterium]|nr:energy-coupling factor transporter transmembrane protein EcfT [Thermoflexales bacterium]MDW8407029.1 energy-coupling factor transporter transmembrane component T [Anaerolineae bacterium]
MVNSALRIPISLSLSSLNPLTKIVAVLPAMLFVALTTDVSAPLALSTLALAVLLVFGQVGVARLAKALVPIAAIALGFLIFYPLIVRRELVAHTPVCFVLGALPIHEGALWLGLTAGLRIFAFVSLTMIFNLTTEAHDFARALVQQAHVPYRAGYAAMTALRFAPLLRYELTVIRAAQRVRGFGEQKGLHGRLEVLWRTAIPLLASAIRRAERAALAMDGRAFGAYPTRTDLRRMRFARRDVAFVIAFWLATSVLIFALWQLGWLGPLAFVQRV